MSSLPTTVPLTELEVVNKMLFSIGESPVNTLDGSVLEAVQALNVLRNINLEVQSHGWHFNTEERFPLQPNIDKEIPIGVNVLSVDASKYEDWDVVQRGQRLYNRRDRTFQFDKEVLCDMTLGLPYDQLPQYARWYICVKATRQFCEGFLGGELQAAFTQRDEQDAWRMFLKVEGRQGDYNILTGSNAVQRVITRRPYNNRIVRF